MGLYKILETRIVFYNQKIKNNLKDKKTEKIKECFNF